MRTQLLIYISLAIVLIFLVLNVPAVNTFDKQLTSSIFNYFYYYQIEWLNNLMRFISENAYLFIIFMFAFIFSEKNYSKSLRFLAYVLIVNAFVIILQAWLGRARPFITIEEIRYLTTAPEMSFGLPSGHAAVSFFVAAYFVKELQGHGIKIRTLEILALIIAAFIAFTRVYLGVHYVIDILAGSLIGLAFAVGIFEFDEWFVAKILPKRKTANRSN